MKKILFSLVILLSVCGCTTSKLVATKPYEEQKSSAGNRVVANVKGEINGLYLFYWIPLWSGEPWRPNERDYDTFTHYVTPAYMSRMLDNYRRRHKYDAVEDLEINRVNRGWWSLGILWVRSIYGSAVMTEKMKK